MWRWIFLDHGFKHPIVQWWYRACQKDRVGCPKTTMLPHTCSLVYGLNPTGLGIRTIEGGLVWEESHRASWQRLSQQARRAAETLSTAVEGREGQNGTGALCKPHSAGCPGTGREPRQALQAVSEALLGGILAVKVQTPSASPSSRRSLDQYRAEYSTYLATHTHTHPPTHPPTHLLGYIHTSIIPSRPAGREIDIGSLAHLAGLSV